MTAAGAAAWGHAALSGAVMGFHAAVILGAPWGRLTMGGRWPGRLPGGARVLSALSAALVAGMAAVVLGRAGVLGWVPPRAAVGAVMALSALSVLANAATPSAPERRLWLPVTVLMLGATALVALSCEGAPVDPARGRR